jgi:hypothetical protein
VRNYLAVQAEDGSIDWKPGLGGQRSRLLAPPLLASLVWRIYQNTEDSAFLEENKQKLAATQARIAALEEEGRRNRYR